jgi:bacterioferritin
MSELDQLLREAYAAEWETAYNYQVLAEVLEFTEGSVAAEEFDADVSEEISHARQLAKRLRVRGENPDFFADQANFGSQEQYSGLDGQEVTECIIAAIEAEQTAIETYTEIVEVAGEVGDYPTEDLAIELLADEQEHLRELQDLLDVDDRTSRAVFGN